MTLYGPIYGLNDLNIGSWEPYLTLKFDTVLGLFPVQILDDDRVQDSGTRVLGTEDPGYLPIYYTRVTLYLGTP